MSEREIGLRGGVEEGDETSSKDELCVASRRHISELVRLKSSGPRHVSCLGVRRGGCPRRYLNHLEKQDDGDCES